MMRHLLDVSALIALGLDEHSCHNQVADWTVSQSSAIFLTCSITELGFVRIVTQVREYETDIANARALLAALKASRLLKFEFISDSNDISRLPTWIKTPKQITDGHLLKLAEAHGASLATLDGKLPGAFLIP